MRATPKSSQNPNMPQSSISASGPGCCCVSTGSSLRYQTGCYPPMGPGSPHLTLLGRRRRGRAVPTGLVGGAGRGRQGRRRGRGRAGRADRERRRPVDRRVAELGVQQRVGGVAGRQRRYQLLQPAERRHRLQVLHVPRLVTRQRGERPGRRQGGGRRRRVAGGGGADRRRHGRRPRGGPDRTPAARGRQQRVYRVGRAAAVPRGRRARLPGLGGRAGRRRGAETRR